MTRIDDRAWFEQMVAIRRDLHRHPELSGQEARTAARVCTVLDELAIPYRRGVAGNGVVADIPGPVDVPAVALRADLALRQRLILGLPTSLLLHGARSSVSVSRTRKRRIRRTVACASG